MSLNLDKQTISTIVASLGIGITLGWIIRGRWRGSIRSKAGITPDVKTENVSESGEFKMVLVVRTDLKMGKGKIAAQCSHASVSCAEQLFRTRSEWLYEWKSCGQPKVVVKTDDEQSLLLLANKAKSLGLTSSVIRDAGRTQIAPGSKTVLGVGPGPASLVDQVTGHLKLC
ncbi:hypothetical protein ScPMuIL_005880 [Solemya velum]